MIYADISVEGVGDGVRILGRLEGRIDRVLKDAVDDIADKIQEAAMLHAPANKDYAAYTWRDRPSEFTLKEHPVDRYDFHKEYPSEYLPGSPGGTTTGFPLFVKKGEAPGSGGYAVRGKGGFVKRRGFTVGEIIPSISPRFIPSRTVAETHFTVTRIVPYATFVHDGTPPYGAKGDFMIYTSALCKSRTPRRYKVAHVKGQQANPYLENAYHDIEPAYTNARVELLRLQLGI